MNQLLLHMEIEILERNYIVKLKFFFFSQLSICSFPSNKVVDSFQADYKLLLLDIQIEDIHHQYSSSAVKFSTGFEIAGKAEKQWLHNTSYCDHQCTGKDAG